MDKFPPAKQRPALLEMAKALLSRDKALRRDENGDWRILGKKGHIYAVPEGFQIMVAGGTAHWWHAAKRRFDFAKVLQDGGDEGIVVLSRLPTPTEAESIRHYCGIAKKREVSEEQRARLLAAVAAFRRNKQATEGSETQ
jgi:hypothetical protein